MLHARADYQARIVDLDDLIPAGEPVLFIRGQDACALDTADAWIQSALDRGVDPDVILAVIEHRDRIAEWQAAGNVKNPDAPADVLS